MSDILNLHPPRHLREQECALFNVLCVEDNRANLALVEQILARRSDIKLWSVTDGLAGVDLAVSLQPAVILMDIQLPGISGSEALQLLKADPATSHIPVIALSSNAYPTQVEKALKAGFFKYLTKPYKIAEFSEAVEAALQFSARAQAAQCNTALAALT